MEVIKEPSRALTLSQRAAVALEAPKYERELSELAKETSTLIQIRDRVSYDQVHVARMKLKGARVEIEKRAKAARQDATDFSKAVIAEEKRLVGLTEPEELRLGELENQYDIAQAEEKRRREETDRQRIATIRSHIEAIRALTHVSVAETTSDKIKQTITVLEATAIDDAFEEFKTEASGAKESTLIRLRLILGTVIGNEREQQRLAQESERLRVEREEQAAAAAAERARIAEEERQAKLRRDEEERQHQAQLKRQREEAQREETERRRIREVEERAERERREAREAEQRRFDEQRAELERREAQVAAAAERIVNAVPPPAVEPVPTVHLVEEPASDGLAHSLHQIAQTHSRATPRPSDDEIITAVSNTFMVPESTAVEWLLAMDLRSQGRDAA